MAGFIFGCVAIGAIALHKATEHNIIIFSDMSAIERDCAYKAYPAVWKFRPDADRPFDAGERVAVRRAAKAVSSRFQDWIGEAYRAKYNFGHFGKVKRQNWRIGRTSKRLYDFGIYRSRERRVLNLSWPTAPALTNYSDIIVSNERDRARARKEGGGFVPLRVHRPKAGRAFIHVTIRGRHPTYLGSYAGEDILQEEPAQIILYGDSIKRYAELYKLPYYKMFEKVAAHEFMHALFHGESVLRGHTADINHFMSRSETEYDNYWRKGITIPFEEKWKMMRCFDEGHHAHYADVRAQRRPRDLF